MRYQIGVAAAFCFLAAPAFAGSAIENACRASDRPASNALCSCIQDVADATLARSDQRRVAKFMSDPDKAQAAQASDSSSADAFWERYTNFAATAEAYCSQS